MKPIYSAGEYRANSLTDIQKPPLPSISPLEARPYLPSVVGNV